MPLCSIRTIIMKSLQQVKKKKFIYEGEVLQTDKEVRKRDGYKGKMPTREENGTLRFSDHKEMMLLSF